MTAQNHTYSVPGPESTNGGPGLYEIAIDTKGFPTPPPYTPKGDVEEAQETSSGYVYKMQTALGSCCSKYKSIIVNTILLLILVGYTVYFAFAIKYSVEGATALIVMTCLVVAWLCYAFIRDHYGEQIYKCCLGPAVNAISSNWHVLKWLVMPALIIAVILVLVLGILKEVRQLQSLSGMVVFTVGLYIFSKYPNRVNWRPVVWGFGLQFLMALLVLRWKPGLDAVKWLSEQITTFINYSMDGAATVFGNPMLLLHPFAFVAMPMLIYIGGVMAILYFAGITQTIAAKIGWFVSSTMGTTAIESLSVGANIFLNGMDTMLMLRTYLPALTRSEFHCFLVGNHSTVAGFAFALFVMFGAPPQHLLSAAVMSAPAAIGVAKLNYPETEESTTKTSDDVELDAGEEGNIIEAAANGASVAGKTVAAVIVNYIAFLSLLAFINAALSWVGGRVGYDKLSFEVICSYLFFPLSILMGIEIGECKEVAKLLGMKVFMSEILAYQELGVSINNGLSDRSASITTYALCGFSSLSTLAIAVGVWNVVCPSKTQEMSNQLPRVITNANLSCFMTACVAGIMYDPDMATPRDTSSDWINTLLGLLPGYKSLMSLLPGY